MKIKTNRLIVSIVLLSFLAPNLILAATLSLSPSTINVTAGQTFTVNVALNPQGVKNYTTKMEFKYPADLLEVQSFVFASNWIPLSQSGYDLVDNASGTMIKSAGYPAGVSSQITFGTITFRAKATGAGNITATTNSASYNDSSQDVLTGVPLSMSVTINQPVSVPSVETVSSPTVAPVAPAVSPTVTEDHEVSFAEEDVENVATSSDRSLLANVGSAMTFGTGNILAGLLFLIILIFAGYGAYSITLRIKNR